MPLYLTGSHSSRVRKSGSKPPSLKKSISSTFSHLSRRKPYQNVQRATSADIYNQQSPEGADERLDVSGRVVSLATISSTDGVLHAIKHGHDSIFCDIPERAGMNSTRIAEVLNFRRGLPSILSLAHVHGLIAASTQTEREIAGLVASGDIRRLTVSGRGNDISGLGEFLILTQDLEARIRDSSLDASVAGAFIELLRRHPRATSLAAYHFLPDDITALRNAGFLLSSGLSNEFTVATAAGNRLAPATISRKASGSVEAAGGQAAFDRLGGIGSARTTNPEGSSAQPGTELTLSLPNTGVYLRLLHEARAHLLELLGRSKYREAPLYVLRERWDGGIDSGTKASNAKRVRGEFTGILPGKTKKWKQLYGLNFDWILEECLGAGLVQLFDTSSVGYGIRIV